MNILFLQAPSFDGFDRRRRFPLSGAARNPVLLVSNLARAGGGHGSFRKTHRCAAAWNDPR